MNSKWDWDCFIRFGGIWVGIAKSMFDDKHWELKGILHKIKKNKRKRSLDCIKDLLLRHYFDGYEGKAEHSGILI